MGSFYRYIKKLSGKNVGGSDTATDHGSSRSVDSGVWPLGTAQAEFHDSVALCGMNYTEGLGGDKTLMVNDI